MCCGECLYCLDEVPLAEHGDRSACEVPRSRLVRVLGPERDDLVDADGRVREGLRAAAGVLGEQRADAVEGDEPEDDRSLMQGNR